MQPLSMVFLKMLNTYSIIEYNLPYPKPKHDCFCIILVYFLNWFLNPFTSEVILLVLGGTLFLRRFQKYCRNFKLVFIKSYISGKRFQSCSSRTEESEEKWFLYWIRSKRNCFQILFWILFFIMHLSWVICDLSGHKTSKQCPSNVYHILGKILTGL